MEFDKRKVPVVTGLMKPTVVYLYCFLFSIFFFSFTVFQFSPDKIHSTFTAIFFPQIVKLNFKKKKSMNESIDLLNRINTNFHF